MATIVEFATRAWSDRSCRRAALEEEHGAVHRVRQRARHERVGTGFTTSRDGGRTFDQAGTAPGSDQPALGVNGSSQGFFTRKLAVNPRGAIAVVNGTFRPNEASGV
jgi:hypothetical protein